MPMKEMERKARQWAFTIPSFDNSTLKRLSNLPSDKVVYAAFAICTDDIGRHFIEGYVKMKRPTRVAALVRLIGYGFFDVCGTHSSITDLLIELKTQQSFLEFGDKEAAQTQGSRQDLESFKLAVEAGLTEDQLKVLHPQICSLYPGFVNNCLIKANRMKAKSESNSETSHIHKTFIKCVEFLGFNGG